MLCLPVPLIPTMIACLASCVSALEIRMQCTMTSANNDMSKVEMVASITCSDKSSSEGIVPIDLERCKRLSNLGRTSSTLSTIE